MEAPLNLEATLREPMSMRWEDFNDSFETVKREVQRTLTQCVNNPCIPDHVNDINVLVHEFPWVHVSIGAVREKFNESLSEWFVSDIKLTDRFSGNRVTLLMVLHRVGIAQLAGL